jgi:hypothetical protein
MLPICKLSHSQSSGESRIMQRKSIYRYQYSNLLVIKIASWKSLGSFSNWRFWSWLGNDLKVVLSGCIDPQQCLRVTHSHTSLFESRRGGSWLSFGGSTSIARAATRVVSLTSGKHPWWGFRQLLSHVETRSNLSFQFLELRTGICNYLITGLSTTVSKPSIDNIKQFVLFFCDD